MCTWQDEITESAGLTIDMRSLEEELHESVDNWRSFVNTNSRAVKEMLDNILTMVSQPKSHNVGARGNSTLVLMATDDGRCCIDYVRVRSGTRSMVSSVPTPILAGLSTCASRPA